MTQQRKSDTLKGAKGAKGRKNKQGNGLNLEYLKQRKILEENAMKFVNLNGGQLKKIRMREGHDRENMGKNVRQRHAN